MVEDIKQFIAEQTEETKRHFDVAAEGLEQKIDQIAEGVAINTKQLADLQGLPEDMGQIRDDVEAIKVTLGIIKNDLKQKVDREEFVALEERVGRLEARAR